MDYSTNQGGPRATRIAAEGLAAPENGSALRIDERSKTEEREAIARLCVERAAYLPGPDRAVILGIYRDLVTVRQVALAQLAKTTRLRGNPALRVRCEPEVNALARALRRRVRVLTMRLVSPKFEFALAYLEPADQAERRALGLPCWTPLRRRIAEACILRGLSVRDAARELDLKVHTVRREVHCIHALFEARRP